MSADFAWLTEHSREIQSKYAGKWIAVLDGEIIAVGETATAVIAEAELKHPGGEFILEAVELDTERV